MPIITKISTQQKNAERYNIFLDEQYAFSVDEEVLARFQLKKGLELAELDLFQIQYEDDIRKATNSAIQYLSHRMRSEHEIRTYLKKKDQEEEVIEAVMRKLHELRYVNDEEFAAAYVRTQVNTTHKGPGNIARELREKGLDEKHIEAVMQEYSDELRVEHAVLLGSKTARQNSRLSERMIKQKIEQALLRKGYPGDTIRIALEEIEYEKDEDEQWEALKSQASKYSRRYSKHTGYEYEQKLKQALFRKGFPIELIDRFLREQSENE